MSPSSYSIAIIDGLTVFLSAYANQATLSAGDPDESRRQALLSATAHLKRIVVEHRPRNMILLHRAGEGLLGPHQRETYAQWMEVAEHMGIPQVEVDNPSIYTMTSKILDDQKASGRPGIMISNDSLLGANLGDEIYYEDIDTLEVYDRKRFILEYGFLPEQLVDFYGLCGHELTGIRGLDFIGPRTAASWMQGAKGDLIPYLEGKADTSKVGKIFSRKKDEYLRNLSALEDILSLPSPKIPGLLPDKDKLHALYDHYKSDRVSPHRKALNNLLERHQLFEMLPKEKIDGATSQLTRLSVISALNSMMRSTSVSLYLEMDKGGKNLVGIGLSDGKSSHGFPLGLVTDYDEKWLTDKIKEVLSRQNVATVANDAKSYYRVFGDDAPPLKADASVLSYTLNSGNGKSTFTDLAARFIPDVEINKAPYSIVVSNGDIAAGEYLGERAFSSLSLNRRIYEACRGTPALSTYQEIEEPVARILAKMDKGGVRVDEGKLLEMKDRLEAKQNEILRSINRRLPAGEAVATLDLANIERLLFDVYKLPPPKLTRSGAKSVSDDALEKLEEIHWLPAQIREYRSATTLISNPITPMLNRLSMGDNMIYPTFNQCITITGRLSSTDPNVQGIPIRTEEGRKIREAFTAPYKHSVVAADYSQIELRILAHISQDETLLSAFRNGEDPHAATAAKVFDVPLEEVTSDQRSAAKAINFGIIYGLTPYGLAKRLGTDKDKASSFIDSYFKAFPGVDRYLKGIAKSGVENGFVDTLGGRRIALFASEGASTRKEIAEVERRACNYPMQGTAAEIIKKAMVDADAMIKNEFPDCKLVMQVHDELVFEAPDAKVEAFSKRVREVMESAVNLSIPLEVDVMHGKSWGKSHRADAKLAIKDRDQTPGQTQAMG